MSFAYGWIDEVDEVRQYCQALIAKSSTDALKPHWDVLIEKAVPRAYWTIVSAFVRRGYSKAQIDQWDRGEEFQMDLAAWFVLKQMSTIHPDVTSQQQLNDLDRRPELALEQQNSGVVQAILTIDGVAVEAESDFGTVHSEAFDTTNDLFVMPTEDTRMGLPTRW